MSVAGVRVVEFGPNRVIIHLQVMVMIAVTWLVPAGVFFTSIIGWQYFVGGRTVPAERCYVQYMENALFNCILQVLACSKTLLSVHAHFLPRQHTAIPYDTK